MVNDTKKLNEDHPDENTQLAMERMKEWEEIELTRTYKTYDEYVSLPVEQRTSFKWFWFWEPWYNEPYFDCSSEFYRRGVLDMFEHDGVMHKRKHSEYCKTGRFLKVNYTTQYYFREELFNSDFMIELRWLPSKVWWKIEKVLDTINEFFNPRQKYLTSKIPNSWCDKTSLVRICLFEMLVHYIEEEDAFNFIDWSSTEKDKKIKQDLEMCYEYIKIRRPQIVKKLHGIHLKDENFIVDYGKMDDEINFWDQRVCETIVKYREALWT